MHEGFRALCNWLEILLNGMTWQYDRLGVPHNPEGSSLVVSMVYYKGNPWDFFFLG